MAAGLPLTDDDRRRVAELHAEGKTRNQIAKTIGRAPSTISKLAAELGLDFDRARTRAATEAKRTDAKARRAQLGLDALVNADGMQRRAMTADSGRDARDYAMAYGVFIDRALRLADYDADLQGLAAVDAWLRDITGTA
jgi:ParB-like chromosome segregation protein Spo0J